MRARLPLALLLTAAAAEHHCPARTAGDDVANVNINGAAVGCYTGPCERCLVGAEFDELGPELRRGLVRGGDPQFEAELHDAVRAEPAAGGSSHLSPSAAETPIPVNG